MTIVSSDYMVDESQGSVEVCASLTDIPAGGLECEVVATINTSDGPLASMSPVYTKLRHLYSGNFHVDSFNNYLHYHWYYKPFGLYTSHVPIRSVAGSDYVPGPLQVTFSTSSVEGSTSCVDIGILQDIAFESNHSFGVEVTSATPLVVMVGTPREGTVTILDDESMWN